MLPLWQHPLPKKQMPPPPLPRHTHRLHGPGGVTKEEQLEFPLIGQGGTTQHSAARAGWRGWGRDVWWDEAVRPTEAATQPACSQQRQTAAPVCVSVLRPDRCPWVSAGRRCPTATPNTATRMCQAPPPVCCCCCGCLSVGCIVHRLHECRNAKPGAAAAHLRDNQSHERGKGAKSLSYHTHQD